MSLANRGRPLELLVVQANAAYRARGLAVIHKVPSAWVPLRRNGVVVSAKVEEKASVDFLGHALPPGSAAAVPVAFDTKEVARGDRWPLSKLEPHQYAYLRDCARTGALAFVLLGFWELRRFYVLGFGELERRWSAWKSGGPASVRADEPGLAEVRFADYLGLMGGGWAEFLAVVGLR